MRVGELATPRNAAELFESDADALFFKSYMPGDVFSDVPDLDHPGQTITVAIVGHPCAIRGAGGKLKTRVPCCLVSQIANTVPYEEWPDGHFDYFPLDDALGIGERQAIRLAEFRPVHRRELARERRVAGLTERGLYILQQRFTHSLTRVAFPLAAFEEGSRHIAAEAEMENEWVEGLASDERDAAMVEGAVKEFHKFLDEDVNGAPRRAGFRQTGGTSAINKEIRAEINRRQAGLD